MPRFSSTLLMLVAVSCHGYSPRPLDTEAIFAAITSARDVGPSGPGVDLATAASWLAESSPILRSRIARYATLAARARTPGSWPDPELTIGPQWASGSAATNSLLSPFASLSLRVPLGARIEAADDLDSARAEVARIDAILTLREQQLALRSDWSAAKLAEERRAFAREAVAIADAELDLATRLVEVGTFGASDIEAIRVEVATREADALADDVELTERTHALAERIGVAANRLSTLAGALPSVPVPVPGIDQLSRLAAAHRPSLIRLRGEYELAERRLRLEVEKQWPDLSLTPSFSDEPGEDKNVFSLGIGLHLPLFDRNQKAVAEAEAERDEVRTRYEMEVGQTIASIETALARVTATALRETAIANSLLPAAARAVELAHRSIEAGSGDGLRLLDALRAESRARLAALGSKAASLQAWFALEQSMGVPLLSFDSAHLDPGSEIPGSLREPFHPAAARSIDAQGHPPGENHR